MTNAHAIEFDNETELAMLEANCRITNWLIDQLSQFQSAIDKLLWLEDFLDYRIHYSSFTRGLPSSYALAGLQTTVQAFAPYLLATVIDPQLQAEFRAALR